MSGLCNSARIDKLLKAHRSYRHTGGDCLICKEGAEATKAQLVAESQSQVGRKLVAAFILGLGQEQSGQAIFRTDDNSDQVEDRLLELCGYFGSFTDACRIAVVERADQLYAFVTSQPWEEGVCDLAGVCSEVKIKGGTQP